MSAHRCCATTKTAARRSLHVASWIVPGALLAAMPKCPVCVAAYVALLTGCGISLAAAGVMRWMLISACVFVLLVLATKVVRARSKC